jgi:dihydrofolate reductase
MSLDGFIARPDDDVQDIFKWYFSGDTEVPIMDGNLVLKISSKSAEIFQEGMRAMGAMVAGRRMFDVAHAWAGHPPIKPCYILTHNPPQEWVKEGSPFTFVADGIESAVAQAKAAAGDKDVAISTASTTQ